MAEWTAEIVLGECLSFLRGRVRLTDDQREEVYRVFLMSHADQLAITAKDDSPAALEAMEQIESDLVLWFNS